MAKSSRIGEATDLSASGNDKCSTPIADRGHLFVYSADGKHFMIPVTYLSSAIFRVLFGMSEEEFDLPSDGPITLPCDAKSCLVHGVHHPHPFQVSMDVERASLTTITSSCYGASSLPFPMHEQQNHILYGF